MTTAQSITFETQDQGEETARAELYGLLAALFYAPPSQTLLERHCRSASRGQYHAGTGLERVGSLACTQHKQEVVREEYERCSSVSANRKCCCTARFIYPAS
jgi:TorA maturation chaperone TorD